MISNKIGMPIRMAVMFGLTLFGLAGCQRAEFKIPPEEASRKNPVGFTRESAADGQRLYDSTDCAICHGAQGDGRGADAKGWRLKIHNWRDPAALKTISDGELFYIILKGKDRMPGYEGEQDSQNFWKMVNYIRSLSARDSSQSVKQEHVN